MPVRSPANQRRRRSFRGNFWGMLCLSIGLIAAALILTRREGPLPAAAQPSPVVAEFDTQTVPVPAEVVAAGTRVGDIKMKMVSYPRHQIPAGALTDISSYADALTTAVVPANLPLFRENLSFTALAGNPVMEKIPPGMRAMTIRVDATSAVEGWAGSGSTVDVILSEKDRSTVIAENVRILSAERSVSPVDGAPSPNVPSTVTLLVTQAQCLAINTAIPLGKIAFALRGGRDVAGWTSTSFDSASLKGPLSSAREARRVSGYVSFSDKEHTRSFALSDDRWVRTEVVPEGFLVNR